MHTPLLGAQNHPGMRPQRPSMRQRLLAWLGPIPELYFSLSDYWHFNTREYYTIPEAIELDVDLETNTLERLVGHHNQTGFENLFFFTQPFSSTYTIDEDGALEITHQDSGLDLSDAFGPSKFFHNLVKGLQMLYMSLLWFTFCIVTAVIDIPLMIFSFPFLSTQNGQIITPTTALQKWVSTRLITQDDHSLQGSTYSSRIMSKVIKVMYSVISLAPVWILLRTAISATTSLIYFPKITLKTWVRNLLETKKEAQKRTTQHIIKNFEARVMPSSKEFWVLKLINKFEPIEIEGMMNNPKLALDIMKLVNKDPKLIKYTGNSLQKAMLKGIDASTHSIKPGLLFWCDTIGFGDKKLEPNEKKNLITQLLDQIKKQAAETHYFLPLAELLENEKFMKASVTERINYCIDRTRPLYTTLLQHIELHDINSNLFSVFAKLLDSLTPEQKILALSAPDQSPSRPNPLLRNALAHGRPNIIALLARAGFDVNVGDLGHLHHGQDIHDVAVEKTVSESLVALVNSDKKLNSNEIATAQRALIQFSKTPPDNPTDNTPDAVAKRAIQRLLNGSYNETREKQSKLNIPDLLAYFWHYHQRLEPIYDESGKSTGNVEASFDVFKYILTSIQRGYSVSEVAADAPICGGGTINQLTIALQSVLPELIWVDRITEPLLTLSALNWIKANLERSFKNAPDETQKNTTRQISGLSEIRFIPPVPDSLWPRIEADLKSALSERLVNKSFTPERYCVDDPTAMIENIIQSLKDGTYKKTHEMQRVQSDILSICKSWAPKPHDNPEHLKSILNLEDQNINEETTKPKVRPILAQYDLKTSKNIEPLTRETTHAYRLLKYHQRFSKQIKKFERRQLEALPEEFRILALNDEFIEKIANILDASVSNEVYLLDSINEHSNPKMDIHVFTQIMRNLSPSTAFDKTDDLEELVKQHSLVLISALLALGKNPEINYREVAKLRLD